MTESVQQKLTKAANWFNEKVLDRDPNKAILPDQILEEALRRLKYPNPYRRFQSDLIMKHWLDIPYRNELVSITTNRINHAVDMHTELVPPKLLDQNEHIFKGILNSFTLHNSFYGRDLEEAKQWLYVKTFMLKTTLNDETAQLIGFDHDINYLEVTNQMDDEGLITHKKYRSGGLFMYLAKPIDPILA